MSADLHSDIMTRYVVTEIGKITHRINKWEQVIANGAFDNLTVPSAILTDLKAELSYNQTIRQGLIDRGKWNSELERDDA